MLIVSPSLVLQPNAFVTPWSPIVGWKTKVVAAGLSATSSATNFPVSNLASASTAEGWLATSVAEQFITLTLSDTDEIDYLAVIRHNFGTAQIEVSVEGFVDSEWFDLADSMLPADDDALIFRFAPQALAQIRLRLQPGNAAATAAVLLVGSLTILPPNIELGFTPLRFGLVTDAGTDESESGHFLGGVVYSQFRESTVSLSYLDPDWYRAAFHPFIKAAVLRRPFVFGWDPLHYPEEVGFAYLKVGANPQPQIQDAIGRMRIQIPMRGIV